MGGLEMKYFVLKPSSKIVNDPYAQASRIAMREYAQHIEPFNPAFADEIRSWADRETQNSVNLEKEDGAQQGNTESV